MIDDRRQLSEISPETKDGLWRPPNEDGAGKMHATPMFDSHGLRMFGASVDAKRAVKQAGS
jgi:hypothetical protein